MSRRLLILADSLLTQILVLLDQFAQLLYLPHLLFFSYFELLKTILLLFLIMAGMCHVFDALLHDLVVFPSAGYVVLDLFDVLLEVLFFACEDLKFVLLEMLLIHNCNQINYIYPNGHMNHLAFEDKLRAIQPFTDTLSPRSHSESELPEATTPEEPRTQKTLSSYKIPDHQQFLDDISSLRKINSEQVVLRDEEIGESNRKTMSSISSTIDILFSKIEKIKEEFSFALQKPSSETEGLDKNSSLDNNSKNKQNQAPSAITHTSKSKPTEPSQLLDSYKPLELHNSNKPEKESPHYHSPRIYYQPLDIFKPWQEQKSSDGLRIRDFHLGKCIGSGKFGDVFMSQHKQTGFMCAIKKILKSTLIEYNMVDQFIKELKIHYQLTHPNVVKLYAHFDDQYHIFLMMELAQKSLIDTLAISQNETAKLVDQVADALVYIHRNKVIHRDLKPQNIVATMGVPKVCDFGWAAIQDNAMHQTFCGTLDYVSPEMKDTGQYNESIDLWSIGVLTFQLIAGFPPFKQQISVWKMKGSKRKIKWNWQVIYPPQIGTQARTFIESLLQVDPIERASLPECKSHSFLVNSRQQSEKEEWIQELENLFQ